MNELQKILKGLIGLRKSERNRFYEKLKLKTAKEKYLDFINLKS